MNVPELPSGERQVRTGRHYIRARGLGVPMGYIAQGANPPSALSTNLVFIFSRTAMEVCLPTGAGVGGGLK